MRVAGFGFRRGTSLGSLLTALAGADVDAVATVDSKVEGLRDLGIQLHLPIIAVTRADLIAHARPGTQRVCDRYGTGSVAESAALAAAGPGAVLVQARQVSADGQAVVAIAEGQT